MNNNKPNKVNRLCITMEASFDLDEVELLSKEFMEEETEFLKQELIRLLGTDNVKLNVEQELVEVE